VKKEKENRGVAAGGAINYFIGNRGVYGKLQRYSPFSFTAMESSFVLLHSRVTFMSSGAYS
jgi:hypothetical protein